MGGGVGVNAPGVLVNSSVHHFSVTPSKYRVICDCTTPTEIKQERLAREASLILDLTVGGVGTVGGSHSANVRVSTRRFHTDTSIRKT